MKSLTWIIILSFRILSAQSYDQVLKKCMANFHEGLGKFTKEKAEAELQRRYIVLNECIHGQKFPAFRMATYHGEKYSSEENAGKVVLLNFWFTKSETSVVAIPYLNEIADEYKDKNFVILSFAADNFTSLNTFLQDHPVKYKIFEKSRDLINHQFNTVLGYPTNIILNKKGEVVHYQVGGGTKQEELMKTKNQLKKLIDTELAN